MKAAAAFSTQADPAQAAAEAAKKIRDAIGAVPAGAVLFACVRSPKTLSTAAGAFADALGTDSFIAATGQSVFTDAGEAAEKMAVAALAFTDVTVTTIGGKLSRTSSHLGFEIGRKLHETRAPAGVILADPGDFEAEAFFREVRRQAGDRALVGGVASAPARSEATAQAVGRSASPGTVAAMLLSGAVDVQVIVTQCCEPMGTAQYITDAEGYTIRRIGGRPAVELLRETLASVPERRRQAAVQNLLAGLAMEARGRDPGRGDYLIRNLVGVEPDEGSIKVPVPVGPGVRFCFQHRDPEVARHDLQERLEAARARDPRPAAFGLYFDCIGRGHALYQEDGVDVGMIRRVLGAFPIAGFRTNGEIGPMGPGVVLHNYTGVLALFRPAR